MATTSSNESVRFAPAASALGAAEPKRADAAIDLGGDPPPPPPPPPLDWVILQFPGSLTGEAGSTSANVFGRVFEAGVTDEAGPAANIVAEVGWGPYGTDPSSSSSWVWTGAAYNTQAGNDDEYMADFTLPSTPGTYSYTYRFGYIVNGVTTFYYADLDGNANGVGFVPWQTGTLTVTAPSNLAPVVDLNGAGNGTSYSGSYSEGDAGVPIGASIAVTDGDSGDNIESATVTLSASAAGDELIVDGVLPQGIAIDPTSTATTLKLSGSAAPADYAAALALVRFRNSSEDPTPAEPPQAGRSAFR